LALALKAWSLLTSLYFGLLWAKSRAFKCLTKLYKFESPSNMSQNVVMIDCATSEISAEKVMHTADADATKLFCRVGVGGVYWA